MTTKPPEQMTRTEKSRIHDTTYRYQETLRRLEKEKPKHPDPWEGSVSEWGEHFLGVERPDHQEELYEILRGSLPSVPSVVLWPRGHGKSVGASYVSPLFIICESTCNRLNTYLEGW